jgi:hypothetical protein
MTASTHRIAVLVNARNTKGDVVWRISTANEPEDI